MKRMNEGRRNGAAFWYSSSGWGVFCSSNSRRWAQTGPKGASCCGPPISLVHSALLVAIAPRPVMVTFSTLAPPIKGTGVRHSMPCALPFVNGSLAAGKLSVAPASMWSTRLLTSSMGPVT